MLSFRERGLYSNFASDSRYAHTSNGQKISINPVGRWGSANGICRYIKTATDTRATAIKNGENPTGASAGAYHPGRGGDGNRGGKFCLVYDRGNYRPEYASNAVGLRLVMES